MAARIKQSVLISMKYIHWAPGSGKVVLRMYSGCSQYDLPTIARRVWDKGHVDCGSSGQRNMMKILILHTQLWGYEGLGYLFCLPVQLMRVLLVAVVVSHRLDVCFVEASKEQHVESQRCSTEIQGRAFPTVLVSMFVQVSRANPKLSHAGKGEGLLYCTAPYRGAKYVNSTSFQAASLDPLSSSIYFPFSLSSLLLFPYFIWNEFNSLGR